MKRAGQLSIIAVTLAAAMGAAAQQIEISSPSIGTVVVTAPRINGTATPASGTQAARNRANARGGTGVDLGIQRRADGFSAARDVAIRPEPSGNGLNGCSSGSLRSYFILLTS